MYLTWDVYHLRTWVHCAKTVEPIVVPVWGRFVWAQETLYQTVVQIAYGIGPWAKFGCYVWGRTLPPFLPLLSSHLLRSRSPPRFPSLALPSEVGPLNPAIWRLGECCNLPQRGLGRRPTRNRIWCILALKYDIWWQQF